MDYQRIITAGHSFTGKPHFLRVWLTGERPRWEISIVRRTNQTSVVYNYLFSGVGNTSGWCMQSFFSSRIARKIVLKCGWLWIAGTNGKDICAADGFMKDCLIWASGSAYLWLWRDTRHMCAHNSLYVTNCKINSNISLNVSPACISTERHPFLHVSSLCKGQKEGTLVPLCSEVS